VATLPHQLHEPLVLEAVVPRLQRVAQGQALHLSRQQVEEAGEVVRIEPLGMRELHRIGPSLGPSSLMPLPKNRGMASPAPASSRRLTMYRDPFSANTNPSGRLRRHFA
jgi:hypothetical protein